MLRKRLIAYAVGLALAAHPLVSTAASEMRLALVIGNASYAYVPRLQNSTNDAKGIAATLRSLGFKVVEVIDGDKKEMSQAISRLRNELKNRDAVAMLYYAGHGLQLDWQNYMVPVDARLDDSKDVPAQTVNVDQVLSVFRESRTRMNIVVLDACRNNPFSDKRGSGGLAQIDAPSSTFISFATAPGNVAEDGDDDMGNGLYTHFLLQELKRPAKIEDVFKRVRLQVRKRSQGRQIPWDSSSLEEDFEFNDGSTAVAAALARIDQENQFLKEKADWDKIKNSKNADDFYAYLEKYPNGRVSEQATFALEQLAKARITAQKDKNGIVQDAGQKRYRVGDEYVISMRDTKSGKEIKKHTTRVEKIENGLVYWAGNFGEEITTEDGASKVGFAADGKYEYDPPVPIQPGDAFQVGKRWISESIQTFRGKQSKRTDSAKVVGFEEVTLPSGKYPTFKVAIEVSVNNDIRVNNVFWFEPGWGKPVKRTRVLFRNGVELLNETYELVSRKRGAG
ncbi:caspase family protein [uncultured Propionivibrio sp.]|uniref:caspase family protein n=1 Tax=uncultured Propionivibrio sp. TaxID=426737 RepID=UPI0029C08B91|nr:caspase family protein [uncultured Propionivibrio sp.]